MNWLRIILAPLVGAVIGYITNDLALKMLFRPYEEVRIGRFRLPFTPGLIPREKKRIAHALGELISKQLLNADTLRSEALSETVLEKMRTAIRSWLEAQLDDERTLRERLESRVASERIDDIQEKLTQNLTSFIMEKLRKAEVGRLAAQQVMDVIRSRLSHLPIAFLLDSILESMRAGIESAVERWIQRDGARLLHEKLTEMENDLLQQSLGDLLAGQRERIPALTEALLGLYRDLLNNHLESLLEAAHLDQIIERKIETFDARELETVVFGVMRRELRAIVYLGALLGFLLGFINLLF